MSDDRKPDEPVLGDTASEGQNFIDADEVRPPSPTEQDPPLAPEGDVDHWRENLDAGRQRRPTSAHEQEGWRSLKLF